jgi:hypothetical protein
VIRSWFEPVKITRTEFLRFEIAARSAETIASLSLASTSSWISSISSSTGRFALRTSDFRSQSTSRKADSGRRHDLAEQERGLAPAPRGLQRDRVSRALEQQPQIGVDQLRAREMPLLVDQRMHRRLLRYCP